MSRFNLVQPAQPGELMEPVAQPAPQQQPLPELPAASAAGMGFATPQPAQAAEPSRFGKVEQEITADTDWKTVFGEAVNNIPSSAFQAVKDIGEAVAHPGQTIKGVLALAAGVGQALDPTGLLGTQFEGNAQMMWDFYKDRYGTIEGFKKALAKDPVGVMMDGATVFIPGGMAVKGLSKAAKLQKLSQLADKAVKAASLADPIALASKGITATGRRMIPKHKARGMYQEAVRFAGKLSPEQLNKLNDTALDNAIMPTQKGLEKLRTNIDLLNAAISDALDRSVTTGQAVPVNALFREYGSIIYDIARKNTDDPKAAQKAVLKARQAVIKANKQIGRKELNARDLQDYKLEVYDELRSLYGKTQYSKPKVRRKMALARAARDKLNDFMPELKKLNAADSDLLALEEAIMPAVNRLDKLGIGGLGTMSKLGAGALLGGDLGLAAGSVLAVYSMPRFKSRLAIILNKWKKQGIPIDPTWASARLLGYQVSQVEQNANSTQEY